MNPDTLTAQALLNCLVREVSVPEEQTLEADGTCWSGWPGRTGCCGSPPAARRPGSARG